MNDIFNHSETKMTPPVETFVEETIAHEVHSRPYLWNTRHPGYKDTVKRKHAFNEIAAGLNIHVDTLRTKWRNMRDRYTKELRKERNGLSHGTASKQWYLMPYLRFLDESSNKEQRNNFREDVTEQSPGLDEFLDVNVEVGKDEEDEYETVISTPSGSIYHTPSSLYDKEAEAFSEHKTVWQVPSASLTDDIGHFCLSMAGALRRLPAQKRAHLQMQFQTMLYEAEFGNKI